MVWCQNIVSRSSCLIPTVPEAFFYRVEEGRIILKKLRHLGFCRGDVLLGDESEPLEIDLLILATGFTFVDKLRGLCVFAFKRLWTRIADRQCVHPRIPQLAFFGFSESIANLFTSEMKCQWLAEFLDGSFKLPSIKETEEDVSKRDKCELPSIKETEEDVSKWDKCVKRYHHHSRSCLDAVQIRFNDQVCKDMGWKSRRKKGLLRELFEPHGPMDHA